MTLTVPGIKLKLPGYQRFRFYQVCLYLHAFARYAMLLWRLALLVEHRSLGHNQHNTRNSLLYAGAGIRRYHADTWDTPLPRIVPSLFPKGAGWSSPAPLRTNGLYIDPLAETVKASGGRSAYCPASQTP